MTRRPSRPRLDQDRKAQVSELHKDDEFGELQGELREDADDVGFQQQLLLKNAPDHDQQQAQPSRQEEVRQKHSRRERNRPLAIEGDEHDSWL